MTNAAGVNFLSIFFISQDIFFDYTYTSIKVCFVLFVDAMIYL